MDDEWAPGEPTPLADVLTVKEQMRRHSMSLTELVERKQVEIMDAIQEMRATALQQVIDVGIDPADVVIDVEQVSALGDPVIAYTVTARWKASGEPL